jgi:hypothetical protein
MQVLTVKFNSIEFAKKMNNVINYSEGFLEGIQLERLNFNRFLGGYTVEALGKYIDSRARINHSALHHVYEPGETGDEGGRLFSFNVTANKSNIHVGGKFLLSKKIPLNGGDPFINRAEIMENDISVTITPRNSSVLAFEDDGQTFFTRNSIVIEHPGGDGVAGSFGMVVDDFFENYFKGAMLEPLMNDLRSADEFIKNFSAGANSGKSIGVKAGRSYFNMVGLTIE